MKFIYKRGTELYVADTLSRAYTNEEPGTEGDDQLHVLSFTSISPMRMAELQRHTLADPVMQKLAHFITDGWPAKNRSVPPDIKPYFPIRDELIIDNGIIFKGLRVVVPLALCKEYIEQLHKGHPGADATERRAKDIVYWPSMSLDIDSSIALCQPCNSAKPHQQKEPLLIHPVPDLPWSHVSADLFDWNGLQYPILIDSYSGWFEMDTLSDLSAKTVIKKIKRHFAVHGIPCRLLTDNGPQFASREFERFASEWSFEHITSSPCFPQSNGLVENSVKQAKNLLGKCKKDGSDPLLGLLNLRNVPRDQTLGSPAQRLMSRRTRCILPVAKKLLTPKALSSGNVCSRLKLKHQQQKAYYDQHAKPLSPLRPQQVVRLETDKGYEKVGIIKQLTAQPWSYIVQAGRKEYLRNCRHLLAVPEPGPVQFTTLPQHLPAATNQDATNPEINPSPIQSPSKTPAKSPGPLQSPARTPVRPQASDLKPVRPQATLSTTMSHVPISSGLSHPGVQRPQVVTRSGRISRPNPSYQDFVT